MPAILDIRSDISRAMAFYNRSGRRAVKKAAAQALNRVTVTVWKIARQQIRKAAGGVIRISKIKQLMKIEIKARFPDKLHTRLSAYSLKDRGINLIEFVKKAQKNPSYWKTRSDKGKTKGSKQYRAGVTAKAWGVERTYRGTFIQYGRVGRESGAGGIGKALVFSGVPGNPKKVNFIFGPSVKMLFVSKTVLPVLYNVANIRWPIEFERALSFHVGFRKKRAAARSRKF